VPKERDVTASYIPPKLSHGRDWRTVKLSIEELNKSLIATFYETSPKQKYARSPFPAERDYGFLHPAVRRGTQICSQSAFASWANLVLGQLKNSLRNC
jgi:hypothetical protein